MSTPKNVKLEPARTVFERFSTTGRSGVAHIARRFGLDYSSVYRWQLSQERHGTGGTIPARYLPGLKDLAAIDGIEMPWELLTGAEFQSHQQ